MQPFQLDSFDTLSSAFSRDGYLVIRGAVPKELLAEFHARVTAEFDRKKANGELFEGGGNISGHLNCFPGAETKAIYDVLEERGLIELVRKLHPKSKFSPNVGCNFNLPGSVAQHYHPDGLFVRDFSILNIAVVDTTLENGAIDLLPGTHTRFFRFWRYAVERQYKRSTRVPMSRGDVLFRISNLWHRGMPNRTQVARPMLAFTWEDGGRESDPFAIHGGKIQFLPNWYRSDLISRVRERTFVTAPITYSAVRFVRSLYSDRGYSAW
jgi:ectoine hydroxylase-related dioxygenase (phytanoyl-CoA dioxygenase family)